MKEIETTDVFFRIEHDILFCSCKQQIEMDLDVAKRIVDDRIKFTGGVLYPILIDFTNLKSATKEAREYMNSPEGGLKGIIAGAFLSNSLATTVLVNLYLKINRPAVPAKFFTKKEDGLVWLAGFKNKKAA